MRLCQATLPGMRSGGGGAVVNVASSAPPAQPDQIAAVISWLASDEASNVNGAVVAADGGFTA
ncbi:SDR family oxidoreductase [Actinoplanes sp. NPDC049265]|uniref:SDR family oxidoreductase n=1 Tax=Actinoplanes sp. NPDC049265 TaxID=3363902 RepID=UPI003716613D